MKLLKKCALACAICLVCYVFMWLGYHLAEQVDNTRYIQAVAVAPDTLEDTTGNLWGYDGLTVGTTYRVCFNTLGTDNITDDIIKEVTPC